ncbi:MAG TPA: DUF2383 domain-containing protein [Polyangiaceae bacterium]
MEPRTIETLNSLLRDELAAVMTYDEALRERSAFSGKTELSRCQRSHETRAAILREKILALGGKPVKTAGVTGVWNQVIERGAAAIGDEMAFRVLEQGEDHVLDDYRRGLREVDAEVRAFLEHDVMPEEEYTHRTMRDLERRLVSS